MLSNIQRISKRGLRTFSVSQHVSASVINSPKLIEKTYTDLMEEQIEKYPHKDFARCVNEDFRWTFAQAGRHQDALAAGLLESSGPTGASFATALPLRSETVIAQVATAKINKTWVPLKPGAKAAELIDQLKVTNPGVLVWPPKFHKTVQLDEIYEVFPYFNSVSRQYQIRDPRFPSLWYILQNSRQPLHGLIKFNDILVYHNKLSVTRAESALSQQQALHNHNVVFLNSQLQEVTHNQYNFVNTSNLVGELTGITEEDIIYSTLQPYTSVGLSLGVALTITRKGKFVWASELFDVEKVTSALGAEYVTTLVAHPEEFHEILNFVKSSKSKVDTTKLKRVIIAATENNPLTSSQYNYLELIQGVKSVLGVKDVFVTFGTQETGGVISIYQHHNEHDSLNHQLVGTPLPHTEVQVVDGNMKPVPVGQPGQLLVKGFNTCGFKNDQLRNSKYDKKGFLLTGVKAVLTNVNNNTTLSVL
eukprot:TRINITY_DN10341_c0_g1_i1.p1 TRINITY_DN10341_c0_g1~~TRINITY_DN10341_c0_g1_i1.p1  ORF type:complete len:476 (-),score=114.80 TRINITY_DN10341_c0_g1_i1:35-1462(-)